MNTSDVVYYVPCFIYLRLSHNIQSDKIHLQCCLVVLTDVFSFMFETKAIQTVIGLQFFRNLSCSEEILIIENAIHSMQNLYVVCFIDVSLFVPNSG